ncbi:hypothetical protein [Actinoallomurus rhizosphaericola]|uniref:hypothetical protein n=1 Tax=Actinoallomurus rhizosphaericola TaxID=2952536 RepID=UPI002091DA58|nr:hypothetical protein [Actinoallomurus rhizosphaericola]MCO5992984.1 hypothetical protein [Actinoallomurus rhizosphaericola]
MSRRAIIAGLLGAGVALTVTAYADESISVAGSETATPSPATPSASTPSPPGPLPSGFQRVSDGTRTVSFGLPDSWKPVDKGDLPGNLVALGAVAYADPASKPRSSTGFLTNVNAFCQANPYPMSKYKAGLRQELVKTGATNIRISDTKVGGRPAIRTSYVHKAGAQELSFTTNTIFATSKECDVTLTTDQPARYQTVFEKITATTGIG